MLRYVYTKQQPNMGLRTCTCLIQYFICCQLFTVFLRSTTCTNTLLTIQMDFVCSDAATNSQTGSMYEGDGRAGILEQCCCRRYLQTHGMCSWSKHTFLICNSMTLYCAVSILWLPFVKPGRADSCASLFKMFSWQSSSLYMGHSPKLCTKSVTFTTKIQNGRHFFSTLFQQFLNKTSGLSKWSKQCNV